MVTSLSIGANLNFILDCKLSDHTRNPHHFLKRHCKLNRTRITPRQTETFSVEGRYAFIIKSVTLQTGFLGVDAQPLISFKKIKF